MSAERILAGILSAAILADDRGPGRSIMTRPGRGAAFTIACELRALCLDGPGCRGLWLEEP